MINISWSQFSKNQAAKDVSFESFCYQVAYLLYKDYGYFENYFNTPGSEFYLTLHSDCEFLNLKTGDEIGWQVKWWYNNEDNSSLNVKNKSILIENFKTTLKYHPDIKLWIICTPGSFVEKEFKKLKTELAKLSQSTIIIHWSKTSFQNFRAENYEIFQALYHHYFNISFIGYDFIANYSKSRISDLNKKFDTDLYTPSKYDDEILSLIDYNKIYSELTVKIKYLADDVEIIESDELYIKKDYSSFDKEYITTAYELLYKCVNVSKRIIQVVVSGLNIEKAKLLQTLLDELSIDYRKMADKLNLKLKSKEYLVSELKSDEKYFHNEYLLSSINKLREQILFSDQKEVSQSISNLLDQVFQRDINIISIAGYGKTNIACNIANVCLNNNIPALLILGSSFRKIEFPQKIILEHLEIDSKYVFNEFLQALNTLGMLRGYKIPIIIDGLNESTSYDSIWKTNIKDIIREIYKHDYLILITTCRDRYIESIFEETDISKIPNIKYLDGLDHSIREKAIKRYFTKYNIEPISWNFNKELFINPLLLRIFSEVNENKSDIRISLDNIFNSIDEYIEIIEKKVSQINSRTDPILKVKIHDRIVEYCNMLWSKNVREIPLAEFHEIIDPHKDSLNDSLTLKLLDEGLCFQKNLSTDSETVQFTFDLIGGYSLAKNILLHSIVSSKEIGPELKKLALEDKIFNKEKEHPLRQDILMSLIHLFPTMLGKNLFEIFDNEIVFEECINSIDYFIGNSNTQKILIEKILLKKTDKRNFKLVFEKIFENSFNKQIYGLEDFLIKILMSLTQAEIDIFWSELIRKNLLVVYPILDEINNCYKKNKIQNRLPKQDIYHSFLTTTSSDKTVRNLATENLYLLAKTYPDAIINFCKSIFNFIDINSIESIIVALCGSVLSLNDKTYTSKVLDLLTLEFITNFKGTHICIIDYINTISEFGKINFNLDYSSCFLYDSKNFNDSFDKSVIEEYSEDNSFFFPHLLGMSLYDFNKYQLEDIATDGFKKRKTFSRIECLSILSNNIKLKGFREEDFKDIHKDFQNDNKYKYGRRNRNDLTFYSEKYLWQSFYELVGYLFLTAKLKSEYRMRYRWEDIFFDPTFPVLPGRFQIINECFFPIDANVVQSWINSDKLDYLNKYLIHNLHMDNEWVLLSLNVVQSGELNKTRIELYVSSFLVKQSTHKEVPTYEDFFSVEPEFSHVFSGEINWSPYFNLNYNELIDDESGLLETTYSYTWSAWSYNRSENPYFKFLCPALSKIVNLKFHTNGVYYTNDKDEQVTKIIRSKDSELYYIRKDVIDEILKKTKLELMWYQSIAKFGEWGKEKDRVLDPSYKHLSKRIYYSKINK